MGEFAYPALNSLTESLEATGVLSEDYQNRILRYALAACSEAYKAGQEKASGQPSVQAQPTVSVTTNPGDFRKFIEDAIENDAPVRIDYTDRLGQESVNREVWPLSIQSNWGSDLVLALDGDDEEHRNFRLDRISKVAVDA